MSQHQTELLSSADNPKLQQEIIRLARTQLGVPWMHQGRAPNVALDCAGLIIFIAKEIGYPYPETANYGINPSNNRMQTILGKYYTRCSTLHPGAIVTMRNSAINGIVNHVAIYTGKGVIHASNGVNPPRVIETNLMRSKDRIIDGYYEWLNSYQ